MADEIFDFLLGCVTGLLIWFFGKPDGPLILLISLIVIDYLSGSCLAWIHGSISSRTGFYGIFKKCIMLTFIGIAHLLDKYLLGGNETIKTVVCLFYISTEGISIIENADKLGIPIPSILRERFSQLKEKHENNNNETKTETRENNAIPKAGRLKRNSGNDGA